ncbi:trihelix transcription factor ASR3-like [Malania oleifera]|uniref:trihelix transcription factor ASR3-like n=1 Tax=Malania oleifera TaxID=397392 RepID=UPI0025ADC23C|nr:trihelix transcription factor ASR3-like [Malania oleifera]
MAHKAEDAQENACSISDGVERQQVPGESTDDRNKALRHPRWTRQETFALIQGKKVIENGVRRGRRSASALGSNQLEPKWDSVSSYCKQNGVNRGPVQCRKRWSNLIGDFKKIRTWESQIKEEADSFWSMRNDLRKERKLPGFFDREVYDAFDGKAFTVAAIPLTLVTVVANAKNENETETAEGEEEEDETETTFDSSRNAAVDDSMFSDFEHGQADAGGSPEEENMGTGSPTKTVPTKLPISGTTGGKQQGSNGWRGSTSHDGRKRRRLSSDGSGDTNIGEQLIKVLERNGNLLNAQLEAQNINFQLDRDQRKDQANNLVVAISKLTDALVKIANKL